MLYTFFIKKDKTHKGDSPVAELIERYYMTFVKNTNDTVIVSLPGYMSTTTRTINDFLKKIAFGKSDIVYFTKGMNGNKNAKPTTQKILDVHNNHYSKIPSLSFVNPNTDHSKMIFFLKTDVLKDENGNIIRCKKVKFYIKAVLIGSSNQSFATYFGPTYDKGEADFFIIDSHYMINEKFKNENEIESRLISFMESGASKINKKIILSKQLRSLNCETLNDIFGKYIADCIREK